MTARIKDLRFHFWSKVDQTDGPDACWPWSGGRDPNGYGRFSVLRRGVGAHRMAWQFTNGPIPNGCIICHHCDNKSCCNPRHLYAGTYSDNMNDAVLRGQITIRRGEQHHGARLTPSIILRIRRRYADLVVDGRRHGILKILADEFGITKPHLHKIINRNLWKSVP